MNYQYSIPLAIFFCSTLGFAQELEETLEQSLVTMGSSKIGWQKKQPLPKKETPAPVQTPCSLSLHGKYDVYLFADFIYWKPTEGGTDYALPTQVPLITPGTTAPQEIAFSAEPGFRLGVGYHLPSDGWEISLATTYLHSSASSQASGIFFPSQALQTGMQLGGQAMLYSTTADSSWSLGYQMLDLRIGQEQTFQKSLLWNPYCGIRGALIHQHFRTIYSGTYTGSPSDPQTLFVGTTNNYNGIGLQAGIKADWSLGHGFRLLGDFSSAILCSKFKVNQTQIGADGIKVMKFHKNFERINPSLDFLAAISWGTYLRCKDIHLEFHAGYQMQYLFRQNQMPRFIDSSSPYYVLESEDLGFRGLTLGGTLDF